MGHFTPSQASSWYQPPFQAGHQRRTISESVYFGNTINPQIYRPNDGGQGNKTEQDKSSSSAPCYHRPCAHHLAWPCTALQLNSILHTKPQYSTLFSAGWMSVTAGQNWASPTPAHSLLLLQDSGCLGHEATAEKSLFLPAGGGGTHKPVSKHTGLYWKQEMRVKTKKAKVTTKTKGSISVMKQSAIAHCSGTVKKLNAFFHLHSPRWRNRKHQLFSSSLPFPITSSSLFHFLVLGRELHCLNSPFLHLSIRSLSSLYIELFSLLQSPKKSLSNFQALFPLVSLLLSYSGLRGWAAKHESSCSKSPQRYCCCMQDSPQALLNQQPKSH